MLFFNEAIILRKLLALLAKIILGVGKKKPIVKLERVQFMMTYNRIKTEMTFQYSLPWDVCSCLLTSWLCFYNPQLPLNC